MSPVVRALLITSPEPLSRSLRPPFPLRGAFRAPDPPRSPQSEPPTPPPPFPVRALGALAPLQSELCSRFGSILLGGRARGRMERLADALTGSPVRRPGRALLADLFGDDGRKAGNGFLPLPLALRRPASGTGAAGVRTGATSSALPPLLLAIPTTILDGRSSGVAYHACPLPAAGKHDDKRR